MSDSMIRDPTDTVGNSSGQGVTENHESVQNSPACAAAAGNYDCKHLELAGVPVYRSEKLDFALIKIPKTEAALSNRIRLADGAHITPKNLMLYLPFRDTPVLTVTASAGLLRGMLSGTPTYGNLAGHKSFNEFWTVKFEGNLVGGDCGSWILDAESGNLYGHIIAGSPNTGTAFVMPAYQVLQKLKTSESAELAKTLQLPDSFTTKSSWLDDSFNLIYGKEAEANKDSVVSFSEYLYSKSQKTRQSPLSPSYYTSGSTSQHGLLPTYSGYKLPAMKAPIMTNVHSPGNQMALSGSMNKQHIPQQMGGDMSGLHQQPPQTDRPFKCDQCPQSFNRSHYLKRHKWVHLAVKPFSCEHCEKSFSRKDALKVRYSVPYFILCDRKLIDQTETSSC